MPRPTKLDAETMRAITLRVRAGLPVELAAEAAGVARGTVLEWLRRGEGRDPDREANALYTEFAMALRKARAEFAAVCMQTCMEAIVGRRPSRRVKGVLVKATGAAQRANEARWHLARRFPEHWGAAREAIVEPETTDAGPPIITIIYSSSEETDGELDDGRAGWPVRKALPG